MGVVAGPGYLGSQIAYNGLANSPFHSLVFGINDLRSVRCPISVQNTPIGGHLCNYCATDFRLQLRKVSLVLYCIHDNMYSVTR